MSTLDAQLGQELQRFREAQLYRTRRIIDGAHAVQMRVDGKACLNFCSNDYLGLAADPRVAEAARAALAAGGTGSGASALISGYNREHAQLEEELAAFLGKPRALLFSSGWAANLGVLRALAGRNDTIVADELNHASLIDGARLAGAQYLRVPHAQTAAYDTALQSVDSGRRLIVSDSVFSMDGDIADVPALADIAARHDAVLMIDDAHGFGVLGPSGRGIEEHFTGPGSRVPSPDVYVATLGKSLGAAGAFVAGSEALIEYLIQRGRTWVFSTAPPPAIAAAARAALRIVRAEPERRAQLVANIARFRAGLAQRLPALAADPTAAASSTAIQPIVLGDEARTLAVSSALLARGYWVAGIRPPTVPRGTSRLRITLTAAHTSAQIDGLLDALAEAVQQLIPAAA